MSIGEIISIGFLVIVAGLVLWNTRRHKGPIDREQNPVDSTQSGGGDQA